MWKVVLEASHLSISTVNRYFVGIRSLCSSCSCCNKFSSHKRRVIVFDRNSPSLNRDLVGRCYLSTLRVNMSKKALIVIANGSEEVELVTPIDTLRRAGIEVTVAGLQSADPVICSRNVRIVPDMSFKEAISNEHVYDAILLPGGLKGAEAFCNSAELGDFLKEQEKSLRLIAAICAAPLALKFHGIGLGKNITSYPSVEQKLTEGDQYVYKEDRVVADGNLITSRGPGSALEWSLAVAAFLAGKEKALEIGQAMLAHCF